MDTNVELPGEIWKPIPEYGDFYEASNLGRIRSTGRERIRADGTRVNKPRQIIQPSTSRFGHKRVVLYTPGRKPKTMTVHRAVMTSFSPRPEEGFVVCHNNGDAADNRLSNLRWDTLSSNTKDMERHGTNVYRNRTHCPRNHPLEEPNLVAGKLRLGLRGCRSCHQAQSDYREGSLLTKEELSDIRYAMIVSGKRFSTRQRKTWEISFIEAGRDLELIQSLEDCK